MKGNLTGFILASTLVGLLGLPTPLLGQNLFGEDEDFVSTLEKMADNAAVKNNNTEQKETLKLENPKLENPKKEENKNLNQKPIALPKPGKTLAQSDAAPTEIPIEVPSVAPTEAPTEAPSEAPAVAAPTPAPAEETPTVAPTPEATPAKAETKAPAGAPTKEAKGAKKDSKEAAKGAAGIPPGQELVSMDFPEMTDIQDIIKAVSIWTGKNVILDRNVNGKIQILSPKKMTKEEAYEAFKSALNVLGLTTVETGKIIKVLKVREAVRDNLQTYMGSSWAPRTDDLITQIIPLKYIDGKQLQTTLSRIVSANSMIAYEPTNTLIVSDSGYKVRRILDIVALLDVETEQPKVVMVRINHSDAKSISDKVNQILQAAGQSIGKTGMRNFKVLVDERTNSVIIFGPPRTIADVRELVKKFDIAQDDPTAQASIHVRPLDYADSKKLSTTLSSLAAGNKGGARRPPVPGGAEGGNGSVADLGDNLKITSDDATNALLITGSKASYNSLNSIIRKLDIRRPQVYIEADIMDLNMSGKFAAGTSIFAGAGNKDGSGTKNIIGWQAGQSMGPLVAAIASASGTQGVNTSALQSATNAFSNDLSIGVLSGQPINIPGLGNVTPGAIINLMKTDSNSRTLSSPNVLTSNNEEATISVGQKIFYKTSVVSAQGTISNTPQKEDVDTTLTIKPNISYSNYVTLNFQIEANKVVDTTSDGYPVIGKRKTKQTVTVKNGQTVVISGMMSDEETEVFQKIPLLGDIPILGWLFRNTRTENKKNNLVIFLRPHIVYGAEDLSKIYQAKLKERDEYFEQVFGKRYAKSDFYQSLPKPEEGSYMPSKEDQAEDTRQAKTQEELKRMIDGPEEVKTSDETTKKAEKPLTVPVPLGNQGTGGPVESAPPAPVPVPSPAPAPEELEDSPQASNVLPPID